MKYHVVDVWCGVIGGDDYGAVDTYALAEQCIADQRARGRKGGCRCKGSGWTIQNCDERHQHLREAENLYSFIKVPLDHECRSYAPRADSGEGL